jgi:AraC-like DNA-binding protein
MPIFMDYHKDLDVTVEDVKAAHTADLATQAKYKVKNLKYWINEQDGTMFCLMEAPDEESCARMHEASHGNLACSIREIEKTVFEMIMGGIPSMDQGLARNEDGSIDSGFRFIMMVHITGQTSNGESARYRPLKIPHGPKSTIRGIIKKHQGGIIENIHDDYITSAFNTSVGALHCALDIQQKLNRQQDPDRGLVRTLSFSIGLAAGQPLTENDVFHEETLRKARHISRFTGDGQIKVSSLFNSLCDIDGIRQENQYSMPAIEILDKPGEQFIMQLMDTTEKTLLQENFSIEQLCKEIGVSRPQLYRKITSLTGKAPTDWIRDLRLERAFHLLQIQHGNVSEIAYEAGFNNLSYFSKCFHKKYGMLPSQYLNTSLPA